MSAEEQPKRRARSRGRGRGEGGRTPKEAPKDEKKRRAKKEEVSTLRSQRPEPPQWPATEHRPASLQVVAPEHEEEEASLQEPVITVPDKPQRSIVFLHGFGCSGASCAKVWAPKLKDVAARLVFLNAPNRTISCYPEKQVERAWHDYFTDHGGEGNAPDVEEVIDVKQLLGVREQIHAILRAEADKYHDGDLRKVALVGESQGACTALDVALTMDAPLAGVWSSYGQLYTSTPVDNHAILHELPIFAFHGACDNVIAASLALKSYARLVAAAPHFSLHVAQKLTHCEPSDCEINLLLDALHAWGFPKIAASNSQKAVLAPTTDNHTKNSVVVLKAPPAARGATPEAGGPPGIVPCSNCGRTSPQLFSKTQLTKGANRRCKDCVDHAKASKENHATSNKDADPHKDVVAATPPDQQPGYV